MDEPTSYLGLGLGVGIPGAFIACLTGLITGNAAFAHGGFAVLVGACALGGAFAVIAVVVRRAAQRAALARALADGPVDRVALATVVGGTRDGLSGWLCARAGGELAFFPADATAPLQLARGAIVDTVASPSCDQLRIVTRTWTWQLSLHDWSGLPVARVLAAP